MPELKQIILAVIPAVIMGSIVLLIFWRQQVDKQAEQKDAVTKEAIKDLQDSIVRLFAEFKSDIKELRAEMKSDHESLGKRIDSHLEYHARGDKKDGKS